jgi:hypothetical protein
MPDDTLRLAVLIDADNASPAVIGDILAEVSKLGIATVKRVYGDFTSSNLNSWRAVLADHAIQPIQQFRNTVGKNASDSALIIDAMDLLHTRELGGFCLVSSDSDFTRLATRIREDGLPVFGLERRKLPTHLLRPAIALSIQKFSKLQTMVRRKRRKRNKRRYMTLKLIKSLRKLWIRPWLRLLLRTAVGHICRPSVHTCRSCSRISTPVTMDSRN